MRALTCALAVFMAAAPAALAAGPPTVSTGVSGGITSSSALVSGTVNPQGQPTTFVFQYGTTTAYGGLSKSVNAGSGTSTVKALANLSGLNSGTTYHYRLAATNGSGTSFGADRTFTTTGGAPGKPPAPGPVVTTGPATAVSPTAATLTGTINPNGQATSYHFQYGTSTAYGSSTATATAGSGRSATAVSATIQSLNPNTVYHFRLVATTSSGTTSGADASFRTSAPASTGPGNGTGPGSGAVKLVASRTRITFGQSTTLSGSVTPRPGRHETVTLERARAAAGPWVRVTKTTAATNGAYSFARLSPRSNTYYRALVRKAISAPVRVAVRFRVALLVSSRHPRAGTRVRLHGRVAPAHRGLRVLIQRRGPHRRWHTIRRTRSRGHSRRFSSYSVSLRITRAGSYRVVALADRSNARGISRRLFIRVR